MSLNENILRIREVMGLLSEQTTKVYTDKKAYDKALQEYNNQMLAYSWTNEVNKNQSKIFGKQNNDTSNYINQYINWNALQTPLGQKIQKVVGLDMKKIFFGVDFLLRQRRWKPNFPEQYSWGKLFFDKLGVDRNNIDFFYIPFEGFQWMVFEKPMIKPILQQAKPPKVTAPTTTAVKPLVQQPPKQEPNTPTAQKPLPDGSSVFGPGNSLIGFIKDRKFTPVDSSMMPNQKNYYGKWDWDLLHDKQKLKDYLKQKFGNYLIYENNNLNESMKVDDWGRLHDEESKIIYPYKRIAKFVTWFDKEYGDYAQKQGWFIVTSDTDLPKTKYKPEEGNKFNLFLQVQRIDDPMEGEAQFGKLKDDFEADRLAKKLGLMLDEFGVVIGYDGESFLNSNEDSKTIKEHTYLKRRISPDEMEESFLDALDYVTYNHVFKNRTKQKFITLVLTIFIDSFHDKLVGANMDFPYQEIWDFLKEKYMNRIIKRWELAFNTNDLPQSQMNQKV